MVKVLRISLNKIFSHSKLRKWSSPLFFILFYIVVSFSFSSLNTMGWGAIRGRKFVLWNKFSPKAIMRIKI